MAMDPRTRYLAGLSAEAQVARHYATSGYRIVAQRWRGGGGEVDLIVNDGFDGWVFVEVKKSATHARASCRVGPAQVRRLVSAAETYLGGLPQGLATPARFDVALVDAQGRIDVIENAIAA